MYKSFAIAICKIKRPIRTAIPTGQTHKSIKHINQNIFKEMRYFYGIKKQNICKALKSWQRKA